MTGKRKRAADASDRVAQSKRLRLSHAASNHPKKVKCGSSSFRLLSNYYPSVRSLRQFLLSGLSSSSKSIRRKLATFGLNDPNAPGKQNFLDSTIVGTLKEPKAAVQEARKRDFLTFTQSQQKSSHRSADKSDECHLAEVSHQIPA